MLSVIIITKNEEANIRQCLESIAWADEIVVLDSGSTDATINIAKEYTEQVYETDWQGYGVQKQRALAYAKGEWVLNLDADEVVPVGLRQAISLAMVIDRFDAYRIPIRMRFYGKVLRFSSSPSRHVRLFKRAGARYSDDIVHEKIVLPANSRISQIKDPILHDSYRDLSHALYKLNRYSSYSAKIKREQKQKSSFAKSIFSGVWMFIRCYALQGGFLDGKEGFLFAVLNSQGAFYRGLKQCFKDQQLEEIPSIRDV